MDFFFTFIFFTSSQFDKNPIVLIPGLYGSNLYATYNNISNAPWYCPKKMKNEFIFSFLITTPLFENVIERAKNVHNAVNAMIISKNFPLRGTKPRITGMI